MSLSRQALCQSRPPFTEPQTPSTPVVISALLYGRAAGILCIIAFPFNHLQSLFSIPGPGNYILHSSCIDLFVNDQLV